MNCYFDQSVGIYLCPKDDSNSKLIKVEKNPSYLEQFFKCAGIDQTTNQYQPCRFSTDIRKEFNNHSKTHKYSQFICLYCSDMDQFKEIKYFHTILALELHILSVHKNRCFQCNLCLYRAISADHVNIHQRFKHCTDSTFIYFCQVPKLNIQLTLKYFYDAFKVERNRINEYQCLYCNYFNSDFQALVIHLTNKHPDYPIMYYNPTVDAKNQLNNIEKDLITDDEELLTDNDDNDDNDDDNNDYCNDNKTFCCFFCDDSFSSYDIIKAHLIEHLFKNSSSKREKFFDDWIDSFISEQYNINEEENCFICIKLKRSGSNGITKQIIKSLAIDPIGHFIQHSSYKPYKCLHCENHWFSEIPENIIKHMNRYHQKNIETCPKLKQLNLQYSFSQQRYKQVLNIMEKELFLAKFCTENNVQCSKLDMPNRNALRILESKYKDYLSSFKKRPRN